MYSQVLADNISPVTPMICDLNEKLETEERKIAVMEENMEQLEMCVIKQNSTPVIAILNSVESLNLVTLKVLLRKNGNDPRVTNEYIPFKFLILRVSG